MNVENHRERRSNRGKLVNEEVKRIGKEEVRADLKKIRNGKTVGPDDTPVAVWRCPRGQWTFKTD